MVASLSLLGLLCVPTTGRRTPQKFHRGISGLNYRQRLKAREIPCNLRAVKRDRRNEGDDASDEKLCEAWDRKRSSGTIGRKQGPLEGDVQPEGWTGFEVFPRVVDKHRHWIEWKHRVTVYSAFYSKFN